MERNLFEELRFFKEIEFQSALFKISMNTVPARHQENEHCKTKLPGFWLGWQEIGEEIDMQLAGQPLNLHLMPKLLNQNYFLKQNEKRATA